MDQELLDVQARFRKGRGTWDQIANILWIIEKARVPEKHLCLLHWLHMLKPLTVWVTTNWKILKEIGIPDHLTCLLRNLYAGQGEIVWTTHGIMDWFQTGKGVHQGYILSPCLFKFYPGYILWNARLDESQAGIKIVGNSINSLKYVDDNTLMAES